MKRTLRRSDGTEEVLEGTPEELAEHERQVKERQAPSTKPPVDQTRDILLGKPLDEWERLLELIMQLPKYDPPTMPWDTSPYWPPNQPVPCGTCQCSPCRCSYRILWNPPTQLTLTWNGNRVESAPGLLYDSTKQIGLRYDSTSDESVMGHHVLGSQLIQ